MSNEIVTYRYSDSDLATCFMMSGYEIENIEITNDKRNGNREKAFVHFTGEKEGFVALQKEFNDGTLKVCPRLFSKTRKRLNSLIKIEIEKFKLQKIDRYIKQISEE